MSTDKSTPSATATRVVAVPSLTGEGLEAERAGHFGHADFQTLVYLSDGEVLGIDMMDNPPHSEGGCLEPVLRLVDRGATDIIVGAMGMRPLNGLLSAGIRVYIMPEGGTVGDALEALLSGQLPAMSAAHACGGHGGCGH